MNMNLMQTLIWQLDSVCAIPWPRIHGYMGIHVGISLLGLYQVRYTLFHICCRLIVAIFDFSFDVGKFPNLSHPVTGPQKYRYGRQNVDSVKFSTRNRSLTMTKPDLWPPLHRIVNYFIVLNKCLQQLNDDDFEFRKNVRRTCSEVASLESWSPEIWGGGEE